MKYVVTFIKIINETIEAANNYDCDDKSEKRAKELGMEVDSYHLSDDQVCTNMHPVFTEILKNIS